MDDRLRRGQEKSGQDRPACTAELQRIRLVRLVHPPRQGVFSKAAFKQYADQNLILVTVDFPNRKKLKKAQQQANQKLMSQYTVRGFPTVYFVDSKGKALTQTGYIRGGAENWVNSVKRAIPAPKIKGGGGSSMRTWKDQKGREIQARLMNYDGSTVKLQVIGGKEISLPASKLSAADQAWLKNN
jgi:hypothetical protein